ncbi:MULTISPECIES: hypothetical protein [Kitasatospora]|uniref:Uncharacterized protein n=1 Tax=Kitasatospora setae (strain ATCC 33774 / DSM 43861 / JCM 3304 / KCC A-0304 / NBRC 14216 / KM-6054) TaxID=452652 RepID=E4NHP0_KITSK|nr:MULTISPECIES: hypothetical protein [Kitasatospora]BAJ31020.1 hypothetical protein KSE_52460 [Kitasatospora setae KM-6054]
MSNHDASSETPWDHWFRSAAQQFMTQLQESLRFCEVIGENDPDFVRALRQVGADIAWAFHERAQQARPAKGAA